MTKLEAYEEALTIFGSLFEALAEREERYFLASIKFDLVFFLFALIENKGSTRALQMRLFPSNFNEWSFGNKWLEGKENNPALWDRDIAYFRSEKKEKRKGNVLGVLNLGLDLKRFSTIEELSSAETLRIVDWKQKRFNIFFFIQNVRTLLWTYRFLRTYETNLTVLRFFRYFLYYAFHVARVRSKVCSLAKDGEVGKVLFSDIDNAWGNSFMLWSKYYGFSQIVHPHGSSLYHNKRRYFEPDLYYVYTTHHERVLRELGLTSEVVRLLPKWAGGAPEAHSENPKNIVFVTGMEKNLEVPVAEKETLLRYIQELSTQELPIAIKSHKLLDWHKEYDALTSSLVRHVHERWSVADIANVGVGVLATTESTLALQFLYCGVPVITCRELVSEIWTKHWSAPILQFEVASSSELMELLARMKEDTEFYKEARREARGQFSSLVPASPKV